MNNTSLTSTEVEIVEELMAEHGAVVTMEQIQALLSDCSPAHIRKRVSQLIRKGWLYRIKRGIYAVCDISQRGSLPLSPYTVSQLLAQESYVSFEAALQFHGFYDQLLATVLSVTTARTKASSVGGMEYRFITTGEKYFYGFEIYQIDGQQVRIAHAEKALIDLVQYHRTTYAVDLVLEVLREYGHELDFDILYEYLLGSTTAVQRIFGFLFDLLEMEGEAERLHALVGDQKNSSRVTAESDLFDARWRLYINQHLQHYRDLSLEVPAAETPWTYNY